MMTISSSRSRSFVRTFASVVLALAVALSFGTAAAHAQSNNNGGGEGNQSEYAALFKEAKQAARAGKKAQQADDVSSAVAKYETAYKKFNKAAGLAKNEGSVENANIMQKMAAQIAYRAGSLLHKNDQSQAAVKHFEFGQKVAPPSYTKNTTGLKAARGSMKQGPVVDASRALRDGNPRRTLELLSEVEEQTGTTYFYRALAHQELGNNKNVVANAGLAINAGGLSTSKQRRLYLAMGEAHMNMGDDQSAREALAQAADLGSDRAEVLMERI
jgi:tetratricopeptide (TPR) repeat protein